jgi:hypothetical protein
MSARVSIRSGRKERRGGLPHLREARAAAFPFVVSSVAVFFIALCKRMARAVPLHYRKILTYG